MNLSVSNIAWSAEYDDEMYAFMQEQGFTGLEIAPTRIFPDRPYDKLSEAGDFAIQLKARYGLTICSMQSIWYGISQSIFGLGSDREFLLTYTHQAILFARELSCGNLVFGCPRNRMIPSDAYLPTAYAFFKAIGDDAAALSTVIALEPNPSFYNTNFINTTQEAFALCRYVDSAGLKVNLDLGTSIYYEDSIAFINDNIDLVHHIHISEPMLAPIQKRQIHLDLQKLDFKGFLSIEMCNQNNISTVKEAIKYIGGLYQ